MKELQKYLDCISTLVTETAGPLNPHINSVTNDSRLLSDNDIFVAIKGAELDGHKFIEQAISSGARVIVFTESQKEYSDNVTYIKVSDSYYAYALLAECSLNFPAKNFNLTGITGTNGKTTTAYIINHILSQKMECGLISTVQYSFGNKIINASRTTPEALQLQKLFSGMATHNCKHVTMEVSSHALHQHRTGSTSFSSAIFTNLSGDHLDYHQTMEAYYEAKKILFSDFLAPDGTAIINIDDQYGMKLKNEIQPSKLLTFGKSSDSLCKIVNFKSSTNGTDIELEFNNRKLQFHTNLIGEHNVYNISAGICAAYAAGLDSEEIIHIISNTTITVPGRMEAFHTTNGVSVFVDYAHTDDALEHALKTLKSLCQSKLCALFGCGGDRDSQKRPRMGKVASKYADSIYLTNDNPRTEDPASIIEQIQTGIPSSPLTLSSDVDDAFKLFSKDVDAVVSMCETEVNPDWMRRENPEGYIESLNGLDVPQHTARQQMPVTYRLNGALYWIKTSVLLDQKTALPPRTVAYKMPSERSIDIDTEFDLKLADFICHELGVD